MAFTTLGRGRPFPRSSASTSRSARRRTPSPRRSGILDYTADNLSGRVRAVYPDGVDALIDLVSYTADGLPLDALRPGGKVASTNGIVDDAALAAANLSGANVNASPVHNVIAALAAQVAAGGLKADINTVMSLERAAEGLTVLASRATRGKIVITIAG